MKNFLLSWVGFTRFRAPIESPKWFRGKPLGFPPVVFYGLKGSLFWFAKSLKRAVDTRFAVL